MKFQNKQIVFQDEAANLALYLLDDVMEENQKPRPMVVICPGGGYCMVSPREAEPVAMQFLAAGFNAAVLTYSVAPARYPTALGQLALSISHIRENAAEYHTNPDKIAVCGFSAGGHLAASLGVKWQLPFMKAVTKLENEAFRPNALILSYPVITSGEYAHEGSFVNLLDEGATENMLAQQSLERFVTPSVPPVFMWHTWDDDTVPVENSLFFASALRAAGVSLEMHIFPHGAHGLSLANKQTSTGMDIFEQPECSCWINLARDWLDRLFDEK